MLSTSVISSVEGGTGFICFQCNGSAVFFCTDGFSEKRLSNSLKDRSREKSIVCNKSTGSDESAAITKSYLLLSILFANNSLLSSKVALTLHPVAASNGVTQSKAALLLPDSIRPSIAKILSSASIANGSIITLELELSTGLSFLQANSAAQATQAIMT